MHRHIHRHKHWHRHIHTYIYITLHHEPKLPLDHVWHCTHCVQPSLGWSPQTSVTYHDMTKNCCVALHYNALPYHIIHCILHALHALHTLHTLGSITVQCSASHHIMLCYITLHIKLCIQYTYIYWLVVYLPLWKIWVRQLGLLFPINGKIQNVPNHQLDTYIHVCAGRILGSGGIYFTKPNDIGCTNTLVGQKLRLLSFPQWTCLVSSSAHPFPVES